jgi:hypothetical protein
LDYAQKIMQLLQERGHDKTICPSEVLPHTEKKDKRKMDQVRAVAKSLIADQLIVAVQKGAVVDLETVVGPIRLRLK